MNAGALWTANEVATATGGQATGDFAALGVSIDSRTISPGDLFVAIKGPNFDGHDFVAAAFTAGAAGAIVTKAPSVRGDQQPLVIVPDTLAALNELAREARRRTSARVLAVTGSVGKTSTKEMLALALGAHGVSFASRGNLNNQWGAPLSLSRLPRRTDFAIFELGMSHVGEISPLSRLVRPEIAIITWVSPAHLEFFASVEDIARAKAEIFDGMPAGGTAILPCDNDHFKMLAGLARAHGAKVVSFGQGEDADCRLIACAVTPRGNEVAAIIAAKRVDYRTPACGRHQAMNSLAALAAVSALGLKAGPAAGALARMETLPGRGRREIVRLGEGAIELIDESYNASPASMRAALGVLGSLPLARGGRRIAVLGDMREMGETAGWHHRALADDLIAAKVDLAFLIGPLMLELHEVLPAAIDRQHAADSLAMAAPLVASLRAGDLVLIKGSLGTRMAPLVEAVRAMDVKNARQRAGNGH